MITRKKPPGAPDTMAETSVMDNIEDLRQEDEPDMPQSEEINLSDKPLEDDTVMIDFESEDYSAEFAAKKTVDSQAEKTTQGRTLGEEELRSQISSHESEKSRSQTFADFQQTAEFILNFFDMIWSNGMRFFAKDSTSSAYQLPKGDLKRLIDPLAMVLAKHSAKFAIEWVFIVGIVAAYSGSFIKAKKRRDELSGKRKPDGFGDKNEYVPEVIFSEEKEEKKVAVKKPGVRGRGRASK